MLKVIATNGNAFEFDADGWSSSGPGLVIFKSGKPVAEFSAYQVVQIIPDQVVPEEPVVEPETPPEAPDPETPEEESSDAPES